MVQARENSCPWANPNVDSTSVGAIDENVSEDSNRNSAWEDTETDWTDHWDLCYKGWSMWKVYPQDNTPNLKSPVIFAPIEAAMAEFNENTIGATLSPTAAGDEMNVKIVDLALKRLETQKDFGKEKLTSLKECMILGSSVENICWLARDRKVEIILNSREIEKEIEKANKSKDKTRKKEIQAILDSNKPLTRKETITEYDDIAYIPVSLYEIWFDPDARCLHGKSYEATDLAWRNLMSLDQFKAEYQDSHDPYLIRENFDKVVSAKRAEADYDTQEPFFRQPTDADVNNDDQVEVLRYYNKRTDQFIIIANDVLYRDGPLPYNHKEIPFVLHNFKKFPHKIYGIGLATVLESEQAEEEALLNNQLELAYLASNPMVFANNNIYNDIEEGMEYPEAGKIVSVSGEVGNDNLRWFQGPSSPVVEVTQLLSKIAENSIKISGVNPLAYSVPKPNEPVRNNMMAMESTMKSLKEGFKNWAEGQKDAIRQEIAIMKQMYTKDKIVRLEGKKVIKAGNSLKEEPINGTSYLRLKPQYFDLSSMPDISIDIDSLVPMSQGLKMQKAEQAMQQLIPIFSNPALMAAPGVAQLVRDFIETHQLDPKLLENLQDESSVREVEEAIKQEKLIEQDNKIEGITGESDAHKREHVATAIEWKTELDNKRKS